ncbi:phospho-sugar mutase [Nicoliella spurrieriana]|uniref:phosphoglucomutase (alpha-D-glucose-1,6-bisphosphate-dependent) n=1 Tax=Nicoliella spurrieriana TaxID=2925830 RepID=A0A976RT65_9LACO|nr:phospho-sugar mutase [Nicoliella spurrieriana]UQS87423.1 phospho-sugar mutase [Nicoliella spurrieriana]
MDEKIKSTYEQWRNEPDMPVDLKHELRAMENDAAQITDAFGATLSFGTAGMRGIIGAGLNRMNIYTVRQATEGLAMLMDQLDPSDKARGVAISFDPRYGSRDFAYNAAQVLGAHGIKSFIVDDIRPVPELSFAVRHLHTYAGIMITASHNPKQYNGFKIYGEDGGQMPPKESTIITESAHKASDLFAIKTLEIRDLRAQGLLSVVGEDIDQAYLDEAKQVNINADLINTVGKDLKFVYSPLHGAGKNIGRRALSTAGFKNFEMVTAQTIADPEFPTTPHPNPEYREAFDLAIKLGKQVDADILIETDPDADRLGAAVRQPDGEYQLMTGNQIASVMLNYILQAKQELCTLPDNGIIVKSIVSTELATKIAAHYHVDTKNVLTGFKYIAEQIKTFEENHQHTFQFGFEESYGYLIRPFVRDKDAIQSTMMLAEVAAYYKQRGMTLYDGLQEMYQKYGYFEEKTISKLFEGLEGQKKMAAIMESLRNDPMTEFAGEHVKSMEDFQTATRTIDDGTTETIDMPQSNVLKYWLDDGTWITIRPSGTEPKVKFYVGVEDQSKDEAMQRLDKYVQAIHELIEKLTK